MASIFTGFGTIEYLWPRLKELIYKFDPELDLITNKEAQKDSLAEVLPKT